MTTKEIIRCFASLQPEQRFSRKDLLSWMREVGLFRDGSEAAITLSLSLMLKNGELIKDIPFVNNKKEQRRTESL